MLISMNKSYRDFNGRAEAEDPFLSRACDETGPGQMRLLVNHARNVPPVRVTVEHKRARGGAPGRPVPHPTYARSALPASQQCLHPPVRRPGPGARAGRIRIHQLIGRRKRLTARLRPKPDLH